MTKEQLKRLLEHYVDNGSFWLQSDYYGEVFNPKETKEDIPGYIEEYWEELKKEYLCGKE